MQAQHPLIQRKETICRTRYSRPYGRNLLNCSGRFSVEAPVMPAALFLSGLSALIAGAFIRACQPAIPAELLTSFCGPTPHEALSSAFHQHCAGCVTMFAGAATMLAASLVPALRKRRARAQ